jgi:hypothetical protein
VLPHYFEKFQTDGVEYNLYLGQSLLEEMPFHSFYLHDFRLWQLILMCEITRLVERQAENPAGTLDHGSVDLCLQQYPEYSLSDG